jgi:hypothetical protein
MLGQQHDLRCDRGKKLCDKKTQVPLFPAAEVALGISEFPRFFLKVQACRYYQTIYYIN